MKLTVKSWNSINNAIAKLGHAPELSQPVMGYLTELEEANPGLVASLGGWARAQEVFRQFYISHAIKSDFEHSFDHPEYEALSLIRITRVKIKSGERLIDYLNRLIQERPWIAGRVMEFIAQDFGKKAYDGFKEYRKQKAHWLSQTVMCLGYFLITEAFLADMPLHALFTGFFLFMSVFCYWMSFSASKRFSGYFLEKNDFFNLRLLRRIVNAPEPRKEDKPEELRAKA